MIFVNIKSILKLIINIFVINLNVFFDLNYFFFKRYFKFI